MKKFQQGFTLIELMIVVAIIGILAAIAIPQYNDYTAKSQASECFSLLDGLKTPMQESFSQDGLWTIPANSVTAGKYVVGIGTADYRASHGGTLVCTYNSVNINAKVVGRAVSMYYDVARGSSPGGPWVCGNNLPTEIQPKACTQTTVP